MTTERRGLFVMRTDETGAKCSEECPHHELHLDEDGEPCVATCDAFANHEVEWDDDGHSVRLAACIEAEQVAAATATLDGWKVGDACEVWLLSGDRWAPGIVASRMCNGILKVSVDGTPLNVHELHIRRPIPPSEPRDGGNRQMDLPVTCECVPEAEPFKRSMLNEHEAQKRIAELERERDEATARAERAERTLQRVREMLEGAYDLGARSREHVTAAMRILDEEGGR